MTMCYNVLKEVIYLKKKKILLSISLFVAFSIICTIIYFIIPTNTTIISQDIEIYVNDKELVEKNEYVFVAKVNKKGKTLLTENNNDDVPYTSYYVEDISYIKGTGETSGTLYFYGGDMPFKREFLFSFNDEKIIEDKYYLFFTNKIGNNKNHSKMNENDFIIHRNDQKILLEDYNNNADLSNQNENIKYTVDRYYNIINKKFTTLNIQTFNSNLEIGNYYDYAFICKVLTTPRVESGSGKNSEIIATKYKTSVRETLKGNVNDLSQYLYLYNVNLWNDSSLKGYTTNLLDENTTYLFLGNIKDDTCQNTRINNGDLVIYSNQQVVKLENYDTSKSLSKQSNEIIDLVNSYIKI